MHELQRQKFPLSMSIPFHELDNYLGRQSKNFGRVTLEDGVKTCRHGVKELGKA